MTKIEIKIKPLHRLLIAMDTICSFMNLIKETDISYSKPNFTTKDYKLEQYVLNILRQIPKETTLYEFQCIVWKNITKLDYFQRTNKLLYSNKCKWKSKEE